MEGYEKQENYVIRCFYICLSKRKKKNGSAAKASTFTTNGMKASNIIFPFFCFFFFPVIRVWQYVHT